MAVSTGHPPGRETTRALIERIAGGDLGAKLRSQVVAWHPGATREDVDEAFQEACVRANQSCRGQSEGEVFTWLRTTTARELGHLRKLESRRSQLEVLVDVSALVPSVAEPTPEEQLIDREDRAEVERATRAVLERLSEQQRAVAALHSRGHKRPEIARHLGMTPRSVKRTLERVMSVGRDELVRLAGHGCDAGEPLIARFAFGLASRREARQAQLHLATCPRCGAMYERLDLWREKVAAILPVPMVAQAHPHLVERAVHGAADAVSTLRRQTRESVLGAREHVADGAAQAKQHVTATSYRVIDPTPLAGVRPGAAAAAIAGCLAVGGGATYCAQNGVDPIAALSGVVAPAHHDHPAKEKPKEARAAQAPTPPAPAATATTPAPVSQRAAQPTPQATTPSAPPPSPQDEFNPVTAHSASTSGASPRSTPTKPAPAPTGGPGEFDGP